MSLDVPDLTSNGPKLDVFPDGEYTFTYST